MPGRMMLHFICPWTGCRYILVYAMGVGVCRYWLASLSPAEKGEVPLVPTRGDESRLAEERWRAQYELVKLSVDGSKPDAGV